MVSPREQSLLGEFSGAPAAELSPAASAVPFFGRQPTQPPAAARAAAGADMEVH